MKYKMIISDVDGTLLDANHQITDENKKAVMEYRRAGGLFTLATGRIEKSAVKIQQELSVDIPLILYNGAKIVDIGKNIVVFEKYLTEDQATAAVRALEVFPVSVILYSGGEGYTLSYTDNIKEHAVMEGINPVLIKDMMTIDLSKVNKILFAGDNDDNDDILFGNYLMEYERICKSLPFIVRSNKRYLEFLPEGVNKGTAVEVLASHLGIPMEEIICFGDNLNDLEMIQKAGLGVAMGNGHEELKEIADFVAPPNTESGLASVINNILYKDPHFNKE